MSLIEYNSKLNDFFNRFNNSKILFNVYKCCGYSEFTECFKDKTLTDFYNDISIHFYNIDITNIYAIKNDNSNDNSNNICQKLAIPKDNSILLKTFIIENKEFFVPIYPLPAKVVYNIYIENSCTSTCTVLGNIFNNI